MFDSPLRGESLILVSLGSIFGAYLRFHVIAWVQSKQISSYWGTFLVNTLASFLLGFCVSFFSKFDHLGMTSQLNLFFSIGFLGSFSTFSSFILDVFKLLLGKNWQTALSILLLSIGVGTMFAFVGYLFGIV